MGRNGQVVGRDHDYTDWQATQECIRIVNEHDTDIPLFFYVAFQVSGTCYNANSLRVCLPKSIIQTRVPATLLDLTGKVNHTPLEVPDLYIEKYPATWRQDRRWYAGMATYWCARLV